MADRPHLNRRWFVVSMGGLPALTLGAAPQPKYVCPPCGCASDAVVFDHTGPCPSCGMALVTPDDLATARKALLPNGVARVEFPFDLLANAIYFPVHVDDKGPYLFALDTGSTNSVIASEVAGELGIKTGAHFASMGAGSDSNMAAMIDTLDVTLPQGVPRTTKQAAVISMAGFWPLIGRRFYGDIGFDIIQPFVVELDYGRAVITLYDPATYRYSGSGTTFPVRMFAGYDPQIDGELVVPGRAPIPVRFTIDTGAGGTIVSSPLVDKYKLIDAVGKTIATQDVGIGGAEPTEVAARISALHIGPYVLDKPVVALSRDKVGSLSSEGISVNLGGNVLRRFTMILNYPAKTVTLEPNGHLAEPFDYDASGLLLTAKGPNFRTFIVTAVIPDTPASDAGVQKGDRISAVDGHTLDNVALWQLEDMLKHAGTTVTLTIQRGDVTLERNVKLRTLI